MSPSPSPLLPTLSRGLLALWCATGLWFSGSRLLSPEVGWRPDASPETSGIIGLPLAESGSVSAIRQTIALAGSSEGPWLVVYPPDVDPVSLQYVQSQLLHTEYPRRVDVITTAGAPRIAGYVGTVTHPRVDFGGAVATVEHRGFAAYTGATR